MKELLIAVAFAVLCLSTPLLAHPSLIAFVASIHNRRPTAITSCHASSITSTTTGLYRPFCDYAFQKLQESELFVPSSLIPETLQSNSAPAKGMPEGTVVQMTTKALLPAQDVVSYARFALLETIMSDSDNTEISTKGIQVMNLVVFPSKQTSLPVWGVDFVTLPGNKHLLAMDVQPMNPITSDFCKSYDSQWKEWHRHYVSQFEWGGDMPLEASKFFSPFAFWTRLVGEEAIETIQDDVFTAFCSHLDLYIQMLQDYGSSGMTSASDETNHQDEYLQYRLANDPARPMLQSLYGPEWTEEVLTRVLFPKEM